MIASRSANIIIIIIVAATILLFNICYVSFSTGFIHKPKIVLETDHYHYIEMAREPEVYSRSLAAHQAPFCWRLLPSFLTYLLTKIGLNIDQAFYLNTNLCLFLFLFTLCLYLQKIGFNRKYSLFGSFLVGMMPGAIRWYEYQYWMSDPLALFFIILAFYLIEIKSNKGLLLLSLIAVTARETYLAVLIYYFFYLLKREGINKALVRGSILWAAPILILLLIRHYIIPVHTFSIIKTISIIIPFRLSNFWHNQLYLVTIGSFGVIFPLLLLFPRQLFRLFREHYDKLIFVLIIYAQLAIANNTDRLLAYALPVLLPAALRSMKRFISETRLATTGIMTIALVLQLIFYVATKFYRQPAISVFQSTNLVVVISLLLFWMGSQALLVFRRGDYVIPSKPAE